MPSSDRLRRPGPRPDPAPRPAEPASDPRAAALLHLQRTAGNQAVLQRLVYNEGRKRLLVPQSYGERRIPWNRETKYQDQRAAKASDPTLLELSKDRDVKGHIGRGMDVSALDEVAAVPDADIRTHTPKSLAAPDADQAVKDDLVRVALAPNELLVHWTNVQYSKDQPADVRWVMSPEDYLPQEPDLPGRGVSVRSPIPGKKVEGKQMKYWEYTCVLIALVKAEGGYDAISRITGETATDLDTAVQALHDHYVGQGIQYDDSSTRFRVMKDWGYKPIFAGRTPWADLPSHVELKKKQTYIFDIEGHTVKVEATADVKKGGARLADPASVLACDSDAGNYNPGSEYGHDVTYIWAR